jgi:hypothetical protein
MQNYSTLCGAALVASEGFLDAYSSAGSESALLALEACE